MQDILKAQIIDFIESKIVGQRAFDSLSTTRSGCPRSNGRFHFQIIWIKDNRISLSLYYE
jgi:hypothetical protein